jgi:hypothetical protein
VVNFLKEGLRGLMELRGRDERFDSFDIFWFAHQNSSKELASLAHCAPSHGTIMKRQKWYFKPVRSISIHSR